MIELKYKEDEIFTNPGSRYRDVYTPNISKDGIIELVVTGKEDLVEYMNSFRDSTDPEILIQRFMNGDTSALSGGNPMFLDLLGAPKTLAEAYALNARAQKAFEGLPDSIRSKFDNSFYKFLECAGTQEWFDTLKLNTEVDPGPIEKESGADA